MMRTETQIEAEQDRLLALETEQTRTEHARVAKLLIETAQSYLEDAPERKLAFGLIAIAKRLYGLEQYKAASGRALHAIEILVGVDSKTRTNAMLICADTFGG